jgi:type II secretory pathway component PulJ
VSAYLDPLAAALLFIAGMILLALFVWAAGRGLMAIANARTHMLAADESEETLRSARKAVGELRQRNVEARQQTAEERDEEIRRAIDLENYLAAQEASKTEDEREGGSEPEERTTAQNEGVEEETPIPKDSFYNT